MLEYHALNAALSYEAIDIADDESLVEQYGIRIPVIKNPETNQEIGWPFEAEEILNLF